MREFLKVVLNHKKNFVPVKVTLSFNQKIQTTVLKILGLKDLNQLRDKYEGVAFLNKVQAFLFGMQVLETHLGTALIDWNKVLKKDFTGDFSMQSIDARVVTFKMNEFPVIQSENSSPIVFVLQKNETTGWICGLAAVETLNNKSNQKLYLNSKGEFDDNVSFIGFDQLKHFENINELKSLTAKHELSIR